ncbi:MAG TPA: WXG100 family type VII secretion target [Actinoplanes sp.]|nr:WXG100 family type VII secretion target [Actinoplanes sp.]
MTLGNQVDDTTTQHVINAMNDADAQCDAAQLAVDNTASYLSSQWTGEASSAFNASIQDWLTGLARVKQGLADLNSAMGTYYQQSIQLEADNSSLATWTS